MNTDATDTILDLTRGRYNSELERINDLDGKANNMTGYVSVVIGLLIGTGTFGVLGKITAFVYYVPYLIGIVLLAVSFLFSLSAIAIREYDFVPNVEVLRDNYSNKSDKFVKRKVIATMVTAVNTMKQQNDDKANKITFSWGFLIAGLGAVIIFVFILALSGNIMCPSTNTSN
jgi:hypothetical protein